MKNFSQLYKNGNCYDIKKFLVGNKNINDYKKDSLVSRFVSISDSKKCYDLYKNCNGFLSKYSIEILSNKIMNSRNYGVRCAFAVNYQKPSSNEIKSMINNLIDLCDNESIMFFLKNTSLNEFEEIKLLKEKYKKNVVDLEFISLINSIINTNNNVYIKECLEKVNNSGLPREYVDLFRKKVLKLDYEFASLIPKNKNYQENKCRVSFNYAMKSNNPFAIFNYIDYKKNVSQDKLRQLSIRLSKIAVPYVCYEYLIKYNSKLSYKDIETVGNSIMSSKSDNLTYKYLYLFNFTFLTEEQKKNLTDEILENLDSFQIIEFISNVRKAREIDLLRLKKQIIISKNLPTLIDKITNSNDVDYLEKCYDYLNNAGVKNLDKIKEKIDSINTNEYEKKLLKIKKTKDE